MSSEQAQDDFVSLFIDFHKEYESPTSFWRWGAYATIAAVLRHNVFFEHKAGKIYPNVYVVFLADSAQYRKGAPIIASRKLLNLVKNTKLFSGTASIQAVLDELSQDIADRSSGRPIKGGGCLITADELASFFVSDPRLIPLLTDMWEFREEFPYKLRGGSIVIKDLCISMLAGSNETFLREVYDSRAVYGGLLGRTFMIKPDETRPANSLVNMDMTNIDNKPLVDSLFKIRDLKGPVRLTPEAKDYYNEWYHDLYNSYKKHPDKTGVLQRMHTNAFKLAIILAAGRYTLEINEEIFKEAIYQAVSLKPNYELYVMSTGKSDQAKAGAIMLDMMWENPPNYLVKHKDFWSKCWNEISEKDFEDLKNRLIAAEMIEVKVVDVNQVAYVMTPRCVEVFKKKIATKG